MSDSLRALLDSSPLGAGNAPYVESLYEQFLADPSSVEVLGRVIDEAPELPLLILVTARP